ncbi:adenosylcobinamide amidohydrolase [Roseobacter sp. HKCCA0434]|uniref:adenosylcobinamide amidohydrolase n=1 Tax=Roseobacter sp. HKCCA0434 TaxID=3079297 RepID=UPI0039670726
MRVLSWAINRPGFVTARRILWREVRNADLPEGLDVHRWLEEELVARGEAESVAFLTSRRIDRVHDRAARIEGITARAVATVGLSNAERVGLRQTAPRGPFGTINIAVTLDTGLGETGLIEALSIAVQARTAAIVDAAIPLAGGLATGTGTDCIALAAPPGATDYAGLHTAIGEAIGRATYEAVREGAEQWRAEQAD